MRGLIPLRRLGLGGLCVADAAELHGPGEDSPPSELSAGCPMVGSMSLFGQTAARSSSLFCALTDVNILSISPALVAGLFA
jgi:hypothetical protein